MIRFFRHHFQTLAEGEAKSVTSNNQTAYRLSRSRPFFA